MYLMINTFTSKGNYFQLSDNSLSIVLKRFNIDYKITTKGYQVHFDLSKSDDNNAIKILSKLYLPALETVKFTNMINDEDLHKCLSCLFRNTVTNVEISLNNTSIFGLSTTSTHLSAACKNIKNLILDGYSVQQQDFINMIGNMIGAKSLAFRNCTLAGFASPFSLPIYTPTSVCLSEIAFISSKSSSSAIGKIKFFFYLLDCNLVELQHILQFY